MNELPLAAMRSLAARAGFSWTDEELEALRPALESFLALIDQLESVPLSEIEPTAQFRMF